MIFFIFAANYNGLGAVKYSTNRMLFVYGEKDSQGLLKRDVLELPVFSNIFLYVLHGAERWLMESHFEEIKKLVIQFLVYDSDDLNLKNEVNAPTDNSPVNIDDLLLL